MGSVLHERDCVQGQKYVHNARGHFDWSIERSQAVQ